MVDVEKSIEIKYVFSSGKGISHRSSDDEQTNRMNDIKSMRESERENQRK